MVVSEAKREVAGGQLAPPAQGIASVSLLLVLSGILRKSFWGTQPLGCYSEDGAFVDAKDAQEGASHAQQQPGGYEVEKL